MAHMIFDFVEHNLFHAALVARDLDTAKGNALCGVLNTLATCRGKELPQDEIKDFSAEIAEVFKDLKVEFSQREFIDHTVGKVRNCPDIVKYSFDLLWAVSGDAIAQKKAKKKGN